MSTFGKVVWQDLTVPDAGRIAEFYSKVVGWKLDLHNMGDYSDFNILDETGSVVCGICHARGENASLPPQWLLYVTVANVENAAAACRLAGGELVDGPRPMGDKPFCVIKDPAGAVIALIEG